MTDSLRELTFVGAERLADLVADGSRLVLLDVGTGGSAEAARAGYDAGHLPGAVFIHLEQDLQAPSAGAAGKRPLPAIEVLQAHAREWGIHDGDTVVVYDRVAGTKAGRAWWLLSWAGVADVRLLDGGLAAWTRGGRPTTTAVVTPAAGDVTLSPGHLPTVTTEEAVELAAAGRLFDARNESQYAEGHIPGGRLAATRANLTEDGLLRDADFIRARYAELGVDGSNQAAFYCGGAVAAAHGVAVLASVGVPVALYVTSFGGWSADPDRELALGAEPAGEQLEAAR